MAVIVEGLPLPPQKPAQQGFKPLRAGHQESHTSSQHYHCAHGFVPVPPPQPGFTGTHIGGCLECFAGFQGAVGVEATAAAPPPLPRSHSHLGFLQHLCMLYLSLSDSLHVGDSSCCSSLENQQGLLAPSGVIAFHMNPEIAICGENPYGNACLIFSQAPMSFMN